MPFLKHRVVFTDKPAVFNFALQGTHYPYNLKLPGPFSFYQFDQSYPKEGKRSGSFNQSKDSHAKHLHLHWHKTLNCLHVICVSIGRKFTASFVAATDAV